MSKRRVTIIAAASAVAGAILGALLAGWLRSHFFGYGMTASSVATVVVEGGALERLEAGDIVGARQILDARLDGELMAIGVAVDNGFVLSPTGKAAIGRIKRVRESSGYAPEDTRVRKMVDDVLQLGAANE